MGLSSFATPCYNGPEVIFVDRSCRSVLSFIKRQSPKFDGYWLFLYFYPDCSSGTGLSEHHVMACVRELEKRGYIRYGMDQHGNIVGFELEAKGYHARYYHWAAVRDFLTKSVLVPIIVTLLTLIVTNLAKSSLPAWLARLLE